MEKETDSAHERRFERRKSLRTERSVTKEQRYDSLQSLSRLVENDLKDEVETVRRVSLPSLDTNLLSSQIKTGVWRRNSSIVEYMQELTTKRQGMIQRLIPDIEQKETSNCEEERDFDTKHTIGERGKNDINSKNFEEFSLKTDSVAGGHGDGRLDSAKMGSNDNELDVEDSVKIVREKISKFEAMKNASRSIHADDFQQFLGARYLELYQKRARRNNGTNELLESSVHAIPSTEDKPNIIDDRHRERFQRRSNLNAKIHSLARQHQLQTGNGYGSGPKVKVTLPPLLNGRDRDKKDFADKPRSILELNAKYGQCFVPIRNDLTDGSIDRCQPKGIPRHAEKRAQNRYHESREINSILIELRRLSSTVQKSEQENLIHQLEEDI